MRLRPFHIPHSPCPLCAGRPPLCFSCQSRLRAATDELEADEIARVRYLARQTRCGRLRTIARWLPGTPLGLDVAKNLEAEADRLERWLESHACPGIAWTAAERESFAGFAHWLSERLATQAPTAPRSPVLGHPSASQPAF